MKIKAVELKDFMKWRGTWRVTCVCDGVQLDDADAADAVAVVVPVPVQAGGVVAGAVLHTGAPSTSGTAKLTAASPITAPRPMVVTRDST